MEYKTNTEEILPIKSCNNSELFNRLSEADLVKPVVPKFYLEQADSYIENADNPTYRQAMELYEIDKSIKAVEAALLLALPIVDTLLQEQSNLTKYRFQKGITLNQIWLDYLFKTIPDDDMAYIINKAFLTENVVYDIFDVLVSSVYRGGQEIVQARLKNALHSQIELDNINIYGIQLVHPLDEYSACTESNINWIDWLNIEHKKQAEIVALYRIKRIVDNHAQDEQQIEMDRKSKSG